MAKIKKLTVKILLDIVMCLALVLLYKAKVLTLTYHEVMGIAILAVFAVHVLLNRTWVVNVGKKLFSKETPARTKFSYWMTVLLVVCFLLIVVSGILISKVVLKDWFAAIGYEPARDVWRPVHLFASAISLVLVGIHLGLYWDMVKAFFRKYLNIPATTTKVVCYGALAVMLVWGCVSIPQAGMVKWLLAPVTPASEHSHGGEATGEAADEAGASTEGEHTADAEREADNQADGERETGAPDAGQDAEQSSDRGEGQNADRSGDQAEAAQTAGERVEGEQGADAQTEGAQAATEQSSSGNHGTNVTLANTLLVISQITSIIAVFATLTYWIDRALKNKRRAQRVNRS